MVGLGPGGLVTALDLLEGGQKFEAHEMRTGYIRQHKVDLYYADAQNTRKFQKFAIPEIVLNMPNAKR